MRYILLLVLFAALMCAQGPQQAAAAAFVVNSTGDGGDSNTADGVCNDGSGACTLRAALEQADAAPALDTITFNIPGPGAHTITPGSVLPGMLNPVTIDGSTQPGYNGKPLIEISGSNSGAWPDAYGIVLIAGSSTVRGLSITGFSEEGIQLALESGNVIQGNYIGVKPDGATADGNATGIGIYWSPLGGHTIGGAGAHEGNVISGNLGAGIVATATEANVIQGNFVGTDFTGTEDLGNGDVGLWVSGSGASGLGNLIGGTTPGAGNVISGNDGSAAVYLSEGSVNNVVQGNLIGTNATGVSPLPNAGTGLFIIGYDGGNNIVGGTSPGAGNVIAGNAGAGVDVVSNGCPDACIGWYVRGNSIYSNEGPGISVFGGPVAPVVSSAGPVAGTSTPGCIIDVYSDNEDEGRIYYGSAVADGAGTWIYNGVMGGPNITATCTDVTGTSEFSAPFASGCAADDADCEGVPDAADNCPQHANPGQQDSDLDGVGDACDAGPSGDIDCSTAVNSIDALKLLRHSAGLVVQQEEPCVDVGLMTVSGWLKGDINCSSAVNSVDALLILRTGAGLSVALPPACPSVADP